MQQVRTLAWSEFRHIFVFRKWLLRVEGRGAIAGFLDGKQASDDLPPASFPTSDITVEYQIRMYGMGDNLYNFTSCYQNNNLED